MTNYTFLGFALMLVCGLLSVVQVKAGTAIDQASCDQFVSNILQNQGSANSASAALSAIGATSISGVINIYTKVTAFGCNSITVASASGYNQGDTVLVIQMKGANIDTISNTPSFGSILKYNDAGNYEFNIIKSISGNIIYFQNALLKSYDPSGMVQLISVPYYNNVTVSGTLTALPWNGNTGGVLVFYAAGTVTLNANIDVTGMGFNGGKASINNWPGCSSTGYYYTMASGLGGHKGEGIAVYGVNYESGRGALANGGGGGNNTNAGGAGGGNYGIGGRGGDQYQGCATTPLGGETGNALTYSNAQNKIFLGGGGGGGHQNDNKGTPGTSGGGIIIIKANAITANNFSVISDGVNNTVFLGNDGAGGGGAGGTILLNIVNYTSALKVQTKGGNGGNNDGPGCHGPGGGGGGGVIWINGAKLPGDVSAIYKGGLSGIANCNSTSYGAASGALGGIIYNLQLVQSNIPATPLPIITVTPDPAVICNGDSVALTASGATSYLWSNGLGTTNSIKVKPISTTTYTLTGSKAGCSVTKNITVTVIANPSAPTATLIQPSCSETNGTITINAPKGIGITYSVDGLTYDNTTGIFSSVGSNTYKLTAKNTDRCISISTSIIINAKPDCLPIAVNDTLITYEKAPVTRNVSINDTPGNGGNVWSLVGVNGGAINGDVTMNPDGTYTYTPRVNFLGYDTFAYQVCDVDGDCSNAMVLVKIIKNPEVFVPNVFTPNGDGIHDLFKIVGLEAYRNPEIQIFNRYGVLIFKKDHYGNLDIWKNEELAWWNGRSENKWNVINDKLPVGTYYYILKLGDGKVLTGFVFLAK